MQSIKEKTADEIKLKIKKLEEIDFSGYTNRKLANKINEIIEELELDKEILTDLVNELQKVNEKQANIINTANIAIKDLQWKFQNMKEEVEQIRDKAEVMDYYTLSDVIEDLNKLLGVD